MHVLVPATDGEHESTSVHNRSSMLSRVSVHEAGSQASLRREFARLIEVLRPDSVLVSTEDPSQSLLRIALDCAPGRVVYLAHTPQMMPFGPASLYPGEARTDWVRQTAGVIVVGRFMREYVQEHSGIEAFVFHPPHYDAPAATPLGRRDGHALLLNACGVKGVAILEQVAQQLPSVSFAAIAGYGTTREDRVRLGRLANVRMLPNPQSLRETLASTSVLLMPTLWLEGFGMAVVDAMLAGVPVLASDYGGLREASLEAATLLPVAPIERFLAEHDDRNLPKAVIPVQDIGPWVRALNDFLCDDDRYQQASIRSLTAATEFNRRLSIEPLVAYLSGLAPKAVSKARQRPAPSMRQRIDALSREKRAQLIRQLRKPSELSQSIPRAAEADAYPLSLSQERLWFLQQLEPESPAYNLVLAVRIRGALNADRLESSLARVVERHTVLRTTFHESNGQALQRISPATPPSLPFLDLSQHDIPLQKARERIVLLASEPFRLDAAPPLRSLLVRVGEDDHVLALVCHHIIVDGWSLAIVAQDWLAYYQSDAKLPPIPLRFIDFAAWQRTCASSDVDLEYWKRQLSGVAKLNLPIDHPRRAQRSLRGVAYGFVLAPDVSDKLQELANEYQATLFMVLVACFHTLLHRYTGQTDITTGSPAAGRLHRDMEGLVGCFVETIVLRSDLAGNPSFVSLLARVRQTAIDAQRHNSVPFERLVELVHPERDVSANPLFQVMLVLQNAPVATAELPGLAFEPLPIARAASQFDITLGLTPTSAGLLGAIEYDADLFEPHTIERMAVHMERLVYQIVADPYQRVGDYQLDADPRNGVLHSSGDSEFPQRRFEAHARANPKAPAVRSSGTTVSYGELEEKASRIAAYLQKLGVGIEDLVAIHMERSVDLVAAMLAVLKCGAAYVPMDPRWPEARMQFIRDDIRPACTLKADVVAEALQHTTVDVQTVQPPSQAAAYVLYTSGSTGQPKGVVLTYANVANFIAWAMSAFSEADLSCVLAATSVCFDLSIFEIFAPLCCGGSLRMVPDIISATTRDFEDVTLLNTVPSSAAALLRAGAFPRRLRIVTLAGEPLGADLVDTLHAHSPEARVFDLYGPTETTTFSTWTEREAGARATIGVPIFATEVLVVDGYGNATPTGVYGEILVGGAGVARGYWKRPGLTGERFVPHPFRPGARLYRTGDRGRWRSNGHLEYGGRFDRQLKFHGFRIEPEDVEQTLVRLPGVIEAFVGERDGSLVAWISGTAAPEHIQAFALQHLPAHSTPTRIVVVDKLPRLPNGKLDTSSLAAPRSERVWDGTWPSVTCEILAGIWERLLGQHIPGPDSNFFELGGHSLLAVQVVSRIRDIFRVELPLRRIFESPVLHGLASAIDSLHVMQGVANWPQVPDTGDFPLSFAQSRMWYLDAFRPDDPTYNIPTAVHVRGNLDRVALQRALDGIIVRHATLRTVFPREGVQRVLPHIDVPIAFVDLVGCSTGDEEVRALQRNETQIGFNLTAGPLLRVTLARLSTHHHVLAVTMHHICSDAWSAQVLLQEWTALYEAERTGADARLPAMRTSYAAYSVWQRSPIFEDRRQHNIAYWRRQLEELPRLEFPVDKPRASFLANEGAVVPVHLGEEWISGLKRLCREESATLFMGLTALWLAALWRYTGQAEIAVGAPLAGRTHSDTENLIGCFINTVCLRVRCADDPPFRELLRRVRVAALEAYASQDVPFEAVLEQAPLQTGSGRSAVFQTLITLQNVAARAPASASLEIEPIDIFGQTAKAELSLSLQEAPSTVSGVLEYNTALFRQETVLRLMVHTRMLLQAFLVDPAQPIGSPLLNAPISMEQVAEDEPLEWLRGVSDDVALRDETRAWSYRELHEFANGVTHKLRACGVGAEDVVAVCLPRGCERIASVLGIWKSGAAFVGIDPDTPAARVSTMLSDASVKVSITNLDLPVRVINAAEITPAVDAPSIDLPENDNLAYVVFTSGSTGRPKCVGLAHRGLSKLAVSIRQRVTVNAADTVLQFASPAFDAFVWEIVMATSAGAALWIGDRQGPATIATIPPSYAGVLGDSPDLRTVIFAGEACRHSQVSALGDGREIYNAYGPSEATICATMHVCCNDGSDPPIGRALPHVGTYILDERGNWMPDGAIGEICISGDAVARGYLNDPASTAERMRPDPYSSTPGARLYRTGDYGRILPNGDLVFLGRRDQQIKLHGYRIELGEIEATIEWLPGVQRAVVLYTDSHLVAHVQGTRITPAELRMQLQAQLPGYMLPVSWNIVEKFPLTTTGKIDLQALAQAAAFSLPSTFIDPPRNPTERLLVDLWAKHLRLPSVGIYQNFFELGGDSILAIRLLAEARQHGLRLSPRQVYDHPTIAELATAGEWVAKTAGYRLTEAPVSPIQRWFLEREPIDPNHYNQAALLLPLVDIQPDLLRQAVVDVYRHHEALQSVFEERAGTWIQRVSPNEAAVFEMSEDGLEAAVSRLPKSFDIASGPCFRLALIRWHDEKPRQRIWIGMHHLVADFFSWRILLEDLQTAYEQRQKGKPPNLPTPALSYVTWSAAQAPRVVPPAFDLPCIRQDTDGPNISGPVAVVEFDLSVGSSEDTRRSLIEAVGEAIRSCFHLAAVAIDVEHNGRTADTLRTVGWFTELVPVLATAEGLVECAPFRAGAEVVVNYVGRLDSYLPERPAFVYAPEPPGEVRSPRQQRSHIFEITGSLRENRLHVSWAYSRNLHTGATITQLIQTCASSLVRRLRNSDTAAFHERFPDAEDVLPLTPLQEGLVYHASSDPTSSAYHQQFVCDLPEPLDPALLQRAWVAVLTNHPSLRAAFILHAEEPAVQAIVSNCLPEWVVEDWTHLTSAEFAGALENHLKGDRRRGFALDRAPLLRFALFRKSADAWTFVWSHHHALLDGWSFPIVAGEVIEAYDTLSRGLPAPARRSDYLKQFIDWVAGQSVNEARAFWIQCLSDVEEPTPLPLRSALPARAGTDYGVHTLTLSRDRTSRLKQAHRSAHCTLGSLVCAAWAMSLAELNNANRAVFGVTFALRPPEVPASDTAVGLFNNTLPFVAELDTDATVRAWLLDVRDALEAMRRHGYVSLSQVQRWIAWSGAPLFDSIVVVENYPHEEGDLESPSDTSRMIGHTHFPLSLGLSPGPAFGLRLTYDRGHYRDEDSRLLLQQFATALDVITESLDRPLRSLRLPAGDAIFGNSANVPREPILLHELFARQAAQTPASAAVVCGAETLSYAELNRRAGMLAEQLARAGAGPETLVGIRIVKGPQLAIAVLGVLKSGAAYLLLDPQSDDARQRELTACAGCAFVLCSLNPPIGSHVRLPQTLPENLAYVVYTSGSTGTPKGCEITHEAIVNRILWSQAQYPLVATDRVLHSAQLGFDFAIWELHAPWAAGATVVFPQPDETRDPDALSVCIERHRVTVAHFVPTAFAVFLQQPVRTSLRLVFTGGEALATRLAQKFLALYDATLVNQYGPAEAAIDVTHFRCGTHVDTETIPIGRPIDNTRIHVVNRHGEAVPTGGIGEIWISGLALARGYRNSPRETAEHFGPIMTEAGPARAYRTGDLGRWRGDGTLEFRGRADRQVKVRGYRIEPAEIEARLAAFPGVRQCAVVPSKGTELAAFVVWASEENFPVRACRNFLKQQLPHFMMPAAFTQVAALPETRAGKIDELALLALAAARASAPDDARHPGPLEDLCRSVWQRVLGKGTIRHTDNFFELGGDSISATRLAIRLSEAIDKQVPVRILFDNPVLSDFVSALERPGLIQTIRRLPRPANGSVPLTLVQLHLWILHTATGGSALFHIPVTVQLDGAIDVILLGAAFQRLVEDFEVLRTAFPMVDEVPVQKVLPVRPAILHVRDLSDLPDDERSSHASQLLVELRKMPFDIEKEPAFRALLIRFAPEQHVLALCAHHIVCDGWSLDVIARRIAADYSGARLPSPSWQYADYALLEADLADRGKLQDDLDYWRTTLDRLPAAPRRAAHSEKRTASRDLAEPLVSALRSVALEHNATPFMLLAAAFQTLLASLTGETDACLATLVANRDLPGMEEQIGLFVNTLLLRTRLDAEQPFAEFLYQMRRTMLEAHAHRLVPFPLVLQHLEQAGMEPAALCRALLVFQNASPAFPPLEGVAAIAHEGLEAAPAPTTFEWILTAGWSGSTMYLRLNCPSSEHTDDDAGRVLDTLVRLLRVASTHPDRPISMIFATPAGR